MTNPVYNADDSNPANPSAAVEKQRPAMELCRDFFEGTDAITARASKYLPQYPAELAENYRARVNRLVVFNAFERTVTGLIGMIFRRNPELGDDVPESIAGDRDMGNFGGVWENLDLAGTHGDIFFRERATDALVDGHAGILVDHPNMGGRVLSRGEEQEAKLRPYAVPIKKSQIVSFRPGEVLGRTVLMQLVLCFEVMRPKGEFGEEVVEEYRVYRRTDQGPSFQIYEKRPGDNRPEPVGPAGIISNQTEIPFVPLYGPRKQGVLVSKPSLQDLAARNTTYLQVESDQLTSMHLAGCPQPVMIGNQMSQVDAEGKTKTGPNWAIWMEAGGAFQYAEHSGQALGALKDKLDDLKSEMAVLGLAMLQRDFRAAETAEGKRMDKAASDSALAVFSRQIQDAAEAVLQFMANFMGEKDGGSVTINKDFDSLTLDPTFIQTLSNLVAAGQLSLETMWQRLAEGEVLPEDFDDEEEKRRIAAQMPPDPDPNDQTGAADSAA